MIAPATTPELMDFALTSALAVRLIAPLLIEISPNLEVAIWPTVLAKETSPMVEILRFLVPLELSRKPLKITSLELRF